jgi:hypothetical protein
MAWFFPWQREMQKAPVGLLRLGRFSIPVVARRFFGKGGVVGEVIDGKDKYFPLSAVIIVWRSLLDENALHCGLPDGDSPALFRRLDFNDHRVTRVSGKSRYPQAGPLPPSRDRVGGM